MTDEAVLAEEAPVRRRMTTGKWLIALIAAVVYAYDAFEGLSNLIGTATSDLAPFLPASVWAVVTGSMLAPVLVYVAAFLVARRMRTGGAALVFLVGLCVSAVLSLTLDELFVVLVVGSL